MSRRAAAAPGNKDFVQEETQISSELTSPSNLELLSEGSIVLGRYKVGRCLGEGAQASVYVVEDIHLQRKSAMKVIRANSDERASERFKREAHVLASLDHENIVKTFSSGDLSDGRHCMVMEFVEGETLEARLARQKTLQSDEFSSIFSQVLLALDYLHKNSVLHRDLKPSNILIENDTTQRERGAANGAPKVKVVDFGIAKIVDELSGSVSSTQTKSVGTANYMSPEQCQSRPLDARSDLYSLACIMYESLFGAPPLSGSSDYDIMYKQISEVPSLPEALSLKGRSFFDKCLQKDQALRYSSAQEMLEAMPSGADLNMSGPAALVRTKTAINPILIGTIALIFLAGGAALLVLQKPQTNAGAGDKFLLSEEQKRPFPGSTSSAFLVKQVELDNANSIPLAEKVLAKCTGKNYWRARVAAGRKLAPYYYSQGNYKLATKILKNVLAEAEANPKGDLDGEIRGNAHFAMVDDLNSAGRYDEARNHLLKAESYFLKTQTPYQRNSNLINLYKTFGRISMGEKNYDEAINYYQKSLALSKERPHEDLSGDCYYDLAQIMFHKKQPQKALQYLNLLREVTEGSDYLQGHLPARLLLAAEEFGKIGDYNRELIFLEEAKVAAKKQPVFNNEPVVAKIYLEQGRCLMKLDQRVKAIGAFQNSLQALRRENTAVVVDTLINLAREFIALGDQRTAFEIYDIALEKIQNYHDTSMNATQNPLFYKALYYWGRQDFGKAQKYFDDAVLLWEKIRPEDSVNLETFKRYQKLNREKIRKAPNLNP